MMKTKIILCLFVLISVNAWAQITLNIDDAVSRALESNLSLQRSQVDIEAARRNYNRSWNTLIPSVNAGAMIAHPTSITGSVLPQQEVWTPGFTLSASLSLTPAIFATIQQTKQEYAAGLINYESARQELEFQVRRLYYQILLLRANAELAEQNIISAQNRHEQTLGLQRVGRASNLDELSARLDVQNQRTNAQNTQAAYQAALDNLKNLLMIPIEETVSLQGNLNIFAIDNQTVNDSASHESMRMGSLRQSIAVIEAQRKAAHLRSYAPTLNLSWNAAPMYMNQYANPTADPVREWRDGNGQFSISLSFKLDNYLPWSSSRSQINSLDDALTKQQSLLMETSINHQNTVQKLFRDITRSEETLETISLTILVAEETLRMYEESYRSGAVDLQSLNSTRDNLRTTQNRLLSEQFNLLSLILELEKELNLPFGSITYE